MKFFRDGSRYVRGGLKQRERIDPRRLMLKDYLQPGALLAFSTMPKNSIANYAVGALANDRYGLCVYAAVAHFVNHWRMNRKSGAIVNEWQVMDAYRETGWDPEIDCTDNGAYMLDVLKKWKKDGYYGTRIRAFVELDPSDRDQVAFACSNMGGVLWGFGLPKTCFDQEVWDVPKHGSEDSKPWSAGGHAVFGPDSSPGRDHCVTWGDLKGHSPAFNGTYASEAYAVVMDDGDGPSPISGLDLDGLLKAAEQVGQL